MISTRLRGIHDLALAGAATLAFCTAACSTEQIQREEARQLSWQGPGAGPCAAGGVTPRAAEHCGWINYGDEGLMGAINAQAAELASGGDSRIHALSVEARVAGRWPVTFAQLERSVIPLWDLGYPAPPVVALVHASEVWALDDGSADLYGATTVLEPLLRQRVGDYAVLSEPEVAQLRATALTDYPQAMRRILASTPTVAARVAD